MTRAPDTSSATDRIAALLAGHDASAGACEAQRRSFAYGTAHIENEAVTRDLIDEEADRFGR